MNSKQGVVALINMAGRNTYGQYNYRVRLLEPFHFHDCISLVKCASVYIGSDAPTDVSAVQTAVLGTVVVTWAVPAISPTGGYQIRLTQGSAISNVMVGSSTSSRHTLTNQPLGVYSIQVIALTMHFPAMSDPLVVTVRGEPDI